MSSNLTPLPTAAERSVPSVGAVRRLRALVAIGHSQSELADRLGMWPSNLSPLIHGKRPRITVARRDDIAELFSLLWSHPVAGPEGDRQRALAKARRWVGPLAWDDIDDPAERPNVRGPRPKKKMQDAETAEVVEPPYIDEIAVERAMRGDKVRLTHAERQLAITKLHARRWSDRRIAAALHVDERTVLRNRHELGLESFEFSQIEQVESA